MRFKWDPVKDVMNIQKHGISFKEAAKAFDDPDGIDLVDYKHSVYEIRRHWVGKIADGRVITVRYTMRGEIIRVFGASEWREHRRMYYEETKHKKS